MIAWKLTVNFDAQRHLFFEKIETGYVTEAYVCQCGQVDFVVKNPTQNVSFQCQQCKNEKFYNANSAWKNIEHFLYQNRDVKFSYEYDVLSDDKHVIARYSTRIPKAVDYVAKKVIFEKKMVYGVALNDRGELKENYLLKFKPEILRTLKKSLTTYLNDHNCLSLPERGDKMMTLSMASFFIKNRELKDFDFYYWDDVTTLSGDEISIEKALKIVSHYPKEKSVKKAVYQNYVDQLRAHGRYYSIFVEAFSKHFSDVNILVKLLHLSFRKSIYSSIDKSGLDAILLFLKKYYTEKQLLKFFSSVDFNIGYYMFRDALSTFEYHPAVIERLFTKVPCQVIAIHDEFVRCTNIERYEHLYRENQHLHYSQQEMRACVKTSHYEVKLPKDGKELFVWAETLHNCMAGYFELIKEKSTLVYCFFQEETLSFAVELKEQKLVQAHGKYNATLTARQKELLEGWFKKFFEGSSHY